MKINQIISVLESTAPLAYQEAFDNSGLLTGSSEIDCTGVLCTLDATEDIIQEAIQKGCNLVVAHHPILFKGITKINGANYVEKALILAIKNDIAIYAIHTNLDNIIGGVNGIIAQKLGLINTKILCPRKNSVPNLGNLVPNEYEEVQNQLVGSGMIGELKAEMNEIDFLEQIKAVFALKLIKHTPLLNRKIKKIAICGGAGSFLIPFAKAAKANFFISADIKYHEFFEAENQLVIADIGHWESEQYTTDLIFTLLTTKFPNFAVLKTAINTNPVSYFLG